jgi:hypothetical protein
MHVSGPAVTAGYKGKKEKRKRTEMVGAKGRQVVKRCHYAISILLQQLELVSTPAVKARSGYGITLYNHSISFSIQQ